MKKNNTFKTEKLSGGGSKTTSMGKDGKTSTITINGANNIRIDPATGKVYSGQSASHFNNLFSGGSSSSSQVTKTGVTIENVSFLKLGSQQIKKMSKQPYKVYTTSDEYKKDPSNSESSSSAKPKR